MNMKHVLLLFLTGLLSAQKSDLTATAQQDHVFISAPIGENVSLPCIYNSDMDRPVKWYKQVFGRTPKLLCSYDSYGEGLTFTTEFNNSCFIQEGSTRNFRLMISDVKYSDTATYYCGINYYRDWIFKAVTVIVKSSRSNLKSSVEQSVSLSIRAGDSVTLNCTVHAGSCDDGGPRVYWVRESGDSHTGLISIHRSSNEECERRKRDTQSHGCVYKLPVENLTESQAGTYYCAVASCGHILFGNGTKLELPVQESTKLVIFLSGSLALTSILVVLLTFCLWKITNQQHCRSKDLTSATYSTAITEHAPQDTENLQYAAIHLKKSRKSRRQKTDTHVTYVYASVKDCN